MNVLVDLDGTLIDPREGIGWPRSNSHDPENDGSGAAGWGGVV